MRVLRFLPRPDADDDPTESWVLEGSDIVHRVWRSDGSWCWSVGQGTHHVENGLSPSRRSAVFESRRHAAGVMAWVLDWGRWLGPGPYVRQ